MDQVLKVTSTTTPSYLVELEIPKQEVILVHRQVEHRKSESLSCIDQLSSSLNSSINLTGCPLEVDLSVEPVTSFPSQQVEDHFPVTWNVARKFINGYMHKDKPIYCVCDGKDKSRVIILGSHKCQNQAIRTIVSICDSIEENLIKDKFKELKQEHVKSVGTSNPKVDITMKCLNQLYGSKLCDSISLGSIAVEATWNSLEYKIPQYGASIKMILQTTVGDECSILYPLLQDLKFLYGCVYVIDNLNLSDEISIEGTYLDFDDVPSIYDLLRQSIDIQVEESPKSLSEALLDMKSTNLNDHLWNILKRCKTVANVKEQFEKLFDLIDDMPSTSQIFYDIDTNTVIGNMINSIYSGTMMRPHLSLKQCLEVLIDLGIQKLKKDYIYLLKLCDFRIGEELEETWTNELKTSLKDARKTTFIDLKVDNSVLQLNYLSHVHVILEFMRLIEQNCSFYINVKLAVLKQLYDSYIINNKGKFPPLFLDTKQNYDCIVPLTYADIKSMDEGTLSKLQLKMVTTMKYSSVVTMFHFSQRPIFPNVIFATDFNDQNETIVFNENKFYAIKLEILTDTI